MKTFMVLILVAVLVALASAGVFMLRRSQGPSNESARSKHMARALAVRVGLSVMLFLIILLSWALGWVQPTGLPTGR